MKTNNRFGEILKAGRENNQLSTRAVEAMTGISYTSISRYENEGIDPSFSYMVLMCDLYGIDLNDLANTVRAKSNHRDRHSRSVPHRTIDTEGDGIGQMLKAGRTRKRLLTRVVDAITGISYASISRYENNIATPSFTYAVLMCDLYGIYLDDLASIVRKKGKNT